MINDFLPSLTYELLPSIGYYGMVLLLATCLFVEKSKILEIPVEGLHDHDFFKLLMWRRKKVAKSDGQEDIQAAESKKPEICTNCIKLMQENSQLERTACCSSGRGKKEAIYH